MMYITTVQTHTHTHSRNNASSDLCSNGIFMIHNQLLMCRLMYKAKVNSTAQATVMV